MRDLVRPIDDPRHVLEERRTSLRDPDDQVLEFVGAGEHLTGVHPHAAIVLLERSRLHAGIGRPKRPLHLQRRHVVGTQAVRVEVDVNNPWDPSHHVRPRHVFDRREPLRQLLRHPPQRELIGPSAAKRQCENGHVVDLDRLDHPARDPRWNDVQVLVDLLEQLHQAALAVLAHVEPHRDDRLPLARHRVDVFHAVDLVQDAFQGRRDELLDLLGAMAGKADEYVGQRHDDLRLFLARRDQQRRSSDQNRQEDQDD